MRVDALNGITLELTDVNELIHAKQYLAKIGQRLDATSGWVVRLEKLGLSVG